VNPPFNAYEYFSFLFPGAVVTASWYYGTMGLPQAEPGAGASLAFVAVAFLVGHAVAAIASWLEPVIWRQRPGSKTDPTWGMFGRGGTYEESERQGIAADFERRFPSIPFKSAYHIGRTELQQLGKDSQLKIMDQQIGFYRNSAFSSILAAAIVLITWRLGYNHFVVVPWLAVFLSMAVLFTYRYRRFWRIFGDNVVRGVRALPQRNERSDEK
jgi:hypothetical protein